MRRSASWALAFGFGLLVAGCNSSTDAPVCIAGRVEACPCADGTMGQQTCLPSGTFDVCACTQHDAAVLDAAAIDASQDDASVTPDGGHDAGPSDVGIDAATDPDAGLIHGHAVLIGAEAQVADDFVDLEITNSVFLSERPGTVNVLEYTQYADFSLWDTQTRVRGLISAEATHRGRTVSFAEMTHSTDLATNLPNADVLFIYGQPRDGSSNLVDIGPTWHDLIDAYLDAGGVVVILTSAHNMGEWHLASGENLFQNSSSPGSGASGVNVIVPTDPVVAGVVSPYPETTSDSITCFPGLHDCTIVARTDGMAPGIVPLPAGCPVLGHIMR